MNVEYRHDAALSQLRALVEAAERALPHITDPGMKEFVSFVLAEFWANHPDLRDAVWSRVVAPAHPSASDERREIVRACLRSGERFSFGIALGRYETPANPRTLAEIRRSIRAAHRHRWGEINRLAARRTAASSVDPADP